MKLTVERLPESQIRLDIAADDDEFSRALDKAFRKVSARMSVPGFRKGKAPRHVVEGMYGREVFLEEAQRDLMEDLYRRAVEQESLTPVGAPEVDLVTVEPLAFAVTVPVYPTVEPGDYSDVRVEPIDAAVDDAAVDEVLERLRLSQSPWVDPPDEGMAMGPDNILQPKVRAAREGDQVTVDYSVQQQGAPFQEPVEDAVFILGESKLFPRLEEELAGMKPGDTAEFTIEFAEDDETVSPEVRGKTLDYTVSLKGIKQRDLLDLDDEFAKSVADAESVDDLRQQVRDDLHQGRTNDARQQVLSQILDQLAERASLELPGPMIDEEVENEVTALRNQLAQRRTTLEDYLRLGNQREDELRTEMRPAAERRLRNSLLLRAVAEREAIAVEDQELEAEIERLTAPTVGSAANPERLRELYHGDYFKNMLRNELFERRLTDRLIEIATEGRGAVINGWVAPEPAPVEPSAGDDSSGSEPSADDDAKASEAPEATGDTADSTPLDDALTTGAMPGQPGDLVDLTGAAAEDTEPAPGDTETAADDDAEGKPTI